MKSDNEEAIESCLNEISRIVKKNSNKSEIGENQSTLAIVKSVEKLLGLESSAQPVTASESENDSFENSCSYIALSLEAFGNIRSPMLSSLQRSNFIFSMSEAYETLGHLDAALTSYESALRLAAESKNQARQGQIQYRMARIFLERGQWQKARDLLTVAIQALELTGNHNEVAQAQIALGTVDYRQGNYLCAKRIFEAALETTNLVSNGRGRALINTHLGIIGRIHKDYDFAQEYFQEALIESQRIQDDHGAAESMNNLGLVHLYMKEHAKALDYFEKALQLCRLIGDFLLRAFIYANKAEFYIEVEDYPMAANTGARALEHLVRLKNPVGLAKINMLFGSILSGSSDFESAAGFYKESMRLYEAFGIPLGLANCYRRYAQMLEETGVSEESAQYRSKAADIDHKLQIHHLEPRRRSSTPPVQMPEADISQ